MPNITTSFTCSGVLLAATAAALIGGAASASAATRTQEGRHRDLGVIAGHHYVTFARLSVSDTQMRATADLHVDDGDRVPVGTYIEVDIFKDGQFCKYRPGKVQQPHNPVQVPLDLPVGACGAGVYTARGFVVVANGAGTSNRSMFTTAGIRVH